LGGRDSVNVILFTSFSRCRLAEEYCFGYEQNAGKTETVARNAGQDWN